MTTHTTMVAPTSSLLVFSGFLVPGLPNVIERPPRTVGGQPVGLEDLTRVCASTGR
jgi:hypothetical protein